MKKILCSILALVMAATMLPFGAMADEPVSESTQYSITCLFCTATLDESYNVLYTPTDTAEAGQTVYIVPTLTQGQYCAMIYAQEQDVTINGNSFEMPSHDVHISCLPATKSNYEYNLTSGECATSTAVIETLRDMGFGVDAENATDHDGGIDLDYDECSDIDFTYEPATFYVTEKAKETKIEEAAKFVTDAYSPYGKLTFVFKEETPPSTYTVTLVRDDGTVLATREEVTEGSILDLGTPTKPATSQYTYTFVRWEPEVAPVTADVTYTAIFEAVPRTRTVTWKNWDGKVIKTVTIPVTETPVYGLSKPTKNSDAKYKYTFSKWNAVVDKTTGDTVYTAEFTKKAIPIKLTASNKTFKQKTKTKKYTVTLKIDGKAASNKKITVKVNSKTYTAKTNKKGQATFNFTKLTKKGTYKATVKYSGNPKSATKKIKITVK